MLNFGSNTLMPETTRQSPGMVNAEWLSYCPGRSLLWITETFRHYVHYNIKLVSFIRDCDQRD